MINRGRLALRSTTNRGNPARICHLATVDLSVRFLLLNQLRRFRDLGMDVCAACADGPWLAEVEAEGIHIFRVPMTRKISPFSDLSALLQLVRIFKRERFDMVHLHTPKASLLGALAACIAGIPRVVYTIHGFYFHEGMNRRRRAYFILCERIISRFVHATLSQNRDDIETAIREGLYKEEGISFLGNGIDLTLFFPNRISRSEREEIRRSLGLRPSGCVVGIVARLVREKGYLELFQAISELRRDFSDIQLLAVGPIEDEKTDGLTPREAERYGLSDISVFTGIRIDMPAMYAAMDLFVLPSHREGFSRALMEASAMGLPVVATNIRGCREAVEDGRTGILVPVNDPTRLAEAMALILRDPEHARVMGQAGRKKAEEQFDENVVFDRILKTYEKMGITP